MQWVKSGQEGCKEQKNQLSNVVKKCARVRERRIWGRRGVSGRDGPGEPGPAASSEPSQGSVDIQEIAAPSLTA